ncbi:HD-GYP domain-containing protein [Bacillus sp. ISL-45]|uniref:HD-GYP domain-containing protein n=1 Tax=Bacillus sp. ISL-45 TaxID=2819128 RepID=UPI001BE91AE3|nr:HD-GYP domain-containing protein [Bacillus sp. ISL-45]
MLIIQSGLLAIYRFHFILSSWPEVEGSLFQWFTYFTVGLAVSTLVKGNLKQKTNLLEVTTALVKSIDSRDPYTATHSESVAFYAKIIAKRLGLREKICDDIYLGGLIHDLGKIGIDEKILNKPSKLTLKEYDVIKQHPFIGYKSIKHVTSFQKNGILDMVLYHHERYDGKGYPEGLKGAEIPFVARIMALADAFDAMTSRRIYKNKKDFDCVIKEIEENKGKQFDPYIADTFLTILKTEGEAILTKKYTLNSKYQNFTPKN